MPKLVDQSEIDNKARPVVHKMMRATKAVLAPSLSASIDTLLADGNAAASIRVINPASGTVTPPARRA